MTTERCENSAVRLRRTTILRTQPSAGQRNITIRPTRARAEPGKTSTEPASRNRRGPTRTGAASGATANGGTAGMRCHGNLSEIKVYRCGARLGERCDKPLRVSCALKPRVFSTRPPASPTRPPAGPRGARTRASSPSLSSAGRRPGPASSEENMKYGFHEAVEMFAISSCFKI